MLETHKLIDIETPSNIQPGKIKLNNTSEEQSVDDIISDTQSENTETSPSGSSESSIIDDGKEVKGPFGQLCSSQAVLDEVLKRYIHISNNSFRGGANGKIQAEFMMCDCQYDLG